MKREENMKLKKKNEFNFYKYSETSGQGTPQRHSESVPT